MEVVNVGALMTTVRARSPDSPLDHVEAAIALGEELASGGDDLIGRFVAEARSAGCSWTEIGARMGVSKQASPAAMICSRRAARACSAIFGTPPVPNPDRVRSGENGSAAASGDSMPLTRGRAVPGCQQQGDPDWRAQNEQRAQQAPVQPVGRPRYQPTPGGVHRTRQVGGVCRTRQVVGELGQLLPGPPGVRGPHPLPVFVRRQPAFRECLIENADSGVTVGVRGKRDRVPVSRPDQVRAMVLPAHRVTTLGVFKMTDHSVI